MAYKFPLHTLDLMTDYVVAIIVHDAYGCLRLKHTQVCLSVVPGHLIFVIYKVCARASSSQSVNSQWMTGSQQTDRDWHHCQTTATKRCCWTKNGCAAYADGARDRHNWCAYVIVGGSSTHTHRSHMQRNRCVYCKTCEHS